MGQGSLDVRAIKDLGELTRFSTEWNEFNNGAVHGATVYNDPSAVLLSLQSDEELEPCVIIVREDGAVRCIAPFYLQTTQFVHNVSVLSFGSRSARMLKLFGNDFVSINGPGSSRYVDAVLRCLSEQMAHCDLVYIFGMLCDSQAWQMLTRPAPNNHFRVFLNASQIGTVHQTRLPPGHSEYMASLGSKTRQNLRRTTRRFFEDGRARLERIDAPTQVGSLLRCLEEITPHTWQAKTFGQQSRSTKLQNDHLELAAARGWLRSYVLFRDEAPVAFELGYQYRGTYYCAECGYDERWSHAGPGAITLHLVMEDLYREDTPDMVDFGYGDAAYKRSFGNVARAAGSIYLTRKRGRWARILLYQQMLDNLSKGVRAILLKARLDSAVRKILKHQRRSSGPAAK